MRPLTQLILRRGMHHHVAMAGADHRKVIDDLRHVREKIGLTSIPLLPYFLNVRFVPRIFASVVTNWYFASPNSAGRFWPCSLFKQRFGIEGFQMTRTAGHEKKDDRFRLRLRSAAASEPAD